MLSLWDHFSIILNIHFLILQYLQTSQLVLRMVPTLLKMSNSTWCDNCFIAFVLFNKCYYVTSFDIMSLLKTHIVKLMWSKKKLCVQLNYFGHWILDLRIALKLGYACKGDFHSKGNACKLQVYQVIRK